MRRSTVWTDHGYRPVCAYCGKPFINEYGDMHEVFISRGVVRGHDRLMSNIMVRYNCVFVHTGDQCHKYATTEEGKRKCIKHLIECEGFVPIRYWLSEINMTMRNCGASEYLNLLEEVHNEMLKLQQGSTEPQR